MKYYWSRSIQKYPENQLASEFLKNFTGMQVFGRNKKYLNEMIFDPVPEYGVTHTLEEACIERAHDILRRPESEFLVLFSGGVDSSLAAISLAIVNQEYNKKIILTLGPESESDTDPRLIDWFIKKNCFIDRNIDIDYVNNYVKRSDGFIISGLQGDNLYLGVLTDEKFKDTIWDMSVMEFFSIITGFKQTQGLVDRYMPVFDDMPVELEKNAPNMLFWLGFYYCWHREMLFFHCMFDIGPYNERHTHFYDSIPFQKWMMQDTKERCGNSRLNFKEKTINVMREMADINLVMKQKNAIMNEINNSNITRPSLFNIFSIDEKWNKRIKN